MSLYSIRHLKIPLVRITISSVIYSDIIITISLYDIYIYMVWVYHLSSITISRWFILKKSWWKSSGFSILQNLHNGAFSPSSRRGTGANWPISRKVASQTASVEWVWFHSRYFTEELEESMMTVYRYS